MSNEIIAAIIQSFAVIVAVVLGFYVTRGTKKLDWRQTQANDFFICSKTYSETVSKFITITFILATDRSLAQDKRTRMEDDIPDLIRQLQLLGWEIKRHSLPANKIKEQFVKCEADLYKAISELVTVLRTENKDRKDQRFDLEKIRELQNAFDKSARELHAELCALA